MGYKKGKYMLKYALRLSLAVLLFPFAIQAYAQPMSGSYTINKNLPAVGNNYISFQSIFNDLAVKGISGNVTIDVVSGSGPYTEQATISSISGAGNSAQITINGNYETLRYTATSNSQKHTLKLDGADYVTIKNLTIEALGSNYAWGVHITNDADNNSIENSTIKITNYTKYTAMWDGIGIAVCNSNLVALNYGPAAKNLIILSCIVSGNANAGPGVGILINPQQSGSIVSNITVIHSQVEDFSSTGIYITSGRGVVVKNNIIQRLKRRTVSASTGISLVNSNQEDTIINNHIHDCYAAADTSYTSFSGIYIVNTLGNIVVANNIINNNATWGEWRGISMSCSQNTKIFHNTIVANSTINAHAGLYGFYHDNVTCSNSTGSEFKNNIVSITRPGSHNRYGVYQNSGAITVDYNNYYIVGANANTGRVGGNNYASLTNWQNATGAGSPFDEHSTAVEPQFLSSNFIPQAIGIDNSGTATNILQDIGNIARNTSTPDVGAYEFTVNANVTDIDTYFGSTCVGEEDSVKVKIVNNSPENLYNFQLGYVLNSQPEVFEVFKDTIPANDSAEFTFKTTIKYPTAGLYKIQSSIKGKPLTGPKQIAVNPLPSGTKFLQAAGFKGFFNGGDAIDPDVVAIADSAVYELTTPIGYANNSYGISWQIEATTIEILSGSKTLNPADTVTKKAFAGQNAKLIFKPSANLSGERIRISTYVKDLNTGCISNAIERYVRVVERPTATFVAHNACEKTAVSFVNTSSGSGMLQYKWHFGDGDSSNLTHPQKIYVLPGQYNVVLYTTTNDGFTDSFSVMITVYNAPETDFKFLNQCEGKAIQFTNSTVSHNGSATYYWEFGDGVGTSAATNPGYLYSTYGFYNVTLVAEDSLGCKVQKSRRVTFAQKPEAKFSFPTLTCNQKKVPFTNNTVSSTGVGFTWSFGDGDTVISKHTEHTYKTEGNFDVTLIAINSFNCVDTARKTITLLATPQVDFEPSTTCINRQIFFNNKTIEPLNTEVKYEWTIDKTTTSKDISPIYTFTAPKVAEIVLMAEADNGCSAQITKTITFSERPLADFVIPQSVCAGIPYTATNNTVLSSGTLSYLWQLGYKTDTATNPTDTFNVKGAYPIQLIASSSNGCADTVVKTLNVYAIPNSNFEIQSRNTGDGTMVFTPEVINGEGNYKWIYSQGGSDTTKYAHEVKFSSAGVYKVTLQIVNKGCASTTVKDVYINPLAINRYNSQGLQVLPNPSNGKFEVKLAGESNIKGIKLYNVEGKLVYESNRTNQIWLNKIDLELSLKKGVYNLVIIGENAQYSKKIAIVN